MKRLLAVLAVLFASVALYASSIITVTPSDMKNGETKTVVDDGKTITIKRDGDSLKLTIEGGGKTKHITIDNSADGELRIEHDGHRPFVFGPNERHRIIINGRRLDAMLERPLHSTRRENWFVCPKDHAMLRVPDAKDDQSYKCPVDGTTMERRKGRAFSFFFDDDLFENEDL